LTFGKEVTRYHTLRRRIAAGLVDTLLFSPTIVVGAIYHQHAVGTLFGYAWSTAMFVSWSAFSIYFHARYGATPGKSLMRCRVVTSIREDKISFRVAIARESPWIALGIVGVFEENWARLQMPSVAEIISYATSVWIVADMLVAVFHPKRRALHDLIAGTVTVKEEPNKAPEPTP
jgi:uncharacterized RDD family membrane protein YckC